MNQKKKIVLSLVIVSFILSITQCRVNANEYLMNVDDKGIILDGYDAVAFFTKKKTVKGKATISFKYKDAIFYFSSEKNRDTFQKNPKKYTPLFGGWCAYAVSKGHVSPVDIKLFKIQDGHLILQHNKRAWTLYEENPVANMKKANGNWPILIAKHKKGRYVGF